MVRRLPLFELARQRVEAVDGDHIALEAQLAHAGLGGPPDQVAPEARSMATSRSGACSAGLGAVPAVGGQHGAAIVGEHQQRAVRAGETRQIADVDQVRDQHRVQPAGADRRFQFVSTLGMCHDP